MIPRKPVLVCLHYASCRKSSTADTGPSPQPATLERVADNAFSSVVALLGTARSRGDSNKKLSNSAAIRRRTQDRS